MWTPKRKTNKMLAEYLKTEFLKDPTWQNIHKLAKDNEIHFRSVYRYLRSVGINSPVISNRKLPIDKTVNK